MADESAAAPAPAVKPAWQTTEFWLNLMTVLVGAVMSIGPILHLAPDNKVMQIAGLGAMLLGATGHTVSRTIIKTSMILVCCLAMSGCAGVPKAAVQTAVQGETELMAELSAYVQSDPKKSDDLKAAEAAKIKAHLDLVNALVK